MRCWLCVWCCVAVDVAGVVDGAGNDDVAAVAGDVDVVVVVVIRIIIIINNEMSRLPRVNFLIK